MRSLIYQEALHRLAEGLCVDEGEKATDWEGLHPVMGRLAEDRPALIEYDPRAAILLWEAPPESIPEPWHSALIALAKNPSPVVRSAIAQAMAFKSESEWLRVRPTAARELSTEEFMDRYQWDVASMMRHEGMTRGEAEIEFTWRYAEEQEEVLRDPENPKSAAQIRLRKSQKAAYHRVYRNC